jgi:uncharacterized membrane protein YccC
MPPQVPDAARTALGKARDMYNKVRPGDPVGRRSLPIRATAAEIEARWADSAARQAVLAGLPPVADVWLEIGEEDRDFGRTTTMRLELDAALPDMATHVLAGKVLRRLKALIETGEIPTTDHNPAYRADAGQEAIA